MPIPPSICCEACISAAIHKSMAAHFECKDCAVRHVKQVIENFRKWGGDAHVEAIKDELAEWLIGDVK